MPTLRIRFISIAKSSIDGKCCNTSTDITLSILPEGKEIVQLSTKQPLTDFKGKVIRMIGNTVDITYQKDVERKLVETMEKLEKSDQLKSEFIRNMEHDIRTPISGIVMLSSQIAKNETDELKKEALLLISDSAERLLLLLNEILTFDKIQKSRPIVKSKFNIYNLVDGIVDLEGVAAAAKNLRIEHFIGEDVPKFLLGDERRTRDILINLLSNAIKFTNKGFVKVHVLLNKWLEKGVLLSLIVEDSGIGISMDDQNLIYDEFTKIHPSNTGLYSGYGLGLKIVKQYVDELRGEINLESNKERNIVVSDAMLKALKRYRLYLGLSSLPSPSENTPLIQRERGKGSIKSTRRIRSIVQNCFDQAIYEMQKDGFSEESQQLKSATVHWLRHTGISEDVKYRPREHQKD